MMRYILPLPILTESRDDYGLICDKMGKHREGHQKFDCGRPASLEALRRPDMTAATLYYFTFIDSIRSSFKT